MDMRAASYVEVVLFFYKRGSLAVGDQENVVHNFVTIVTRSFYAIEQFI